MNITSQELTAYIASYLWPFFRIAAMIAVVPILGTKIVPKKVRLGLALFITIIVVPMLEPFPDVAPFSADGILITIYQVLIGLAMGFMVRFVFSALETGGHLIGQTMGLGFAQMVDPANGITVPVVSQFYTIVATLIFLALNGHLILIEMLVDSFNTLPVAVQGISPDGWWAIIAWTKWIFIGAVLIALPSLSALLLVNVSFGVMMRAAPQLNIFAIGFPITLMLGFVFMLATLPIFLPQFSSLMDSAFLTIRGVVAGG